jgi:hypothetical protein
METGKNRLLCVYASGTLNVLECDSMDATQKKLNERLAQLDNQLYALRRERDAITTALSVAGARPPEAHKMIYTAQESEYWREKPFSKMALTDACLKVLRDHAEHEESHEQWLDKNQVEYLLSRGGYEFKAEDATNSVNVTLRRLAAEGYSEAHGGKGSRPIKYHFLKERLPDAKPAYRPGEKLGRAFSDVVAADDSDSRATKGPK